MNRLIVCIVLAVPVLTWAAFAQVAAPHAATVPVDVVALVTAVFTGIAALGGIFVSVFLPILAHRQKRAEAAAALTVLEIAKAQLSLNETKLEIAKAHLELSRVKDNVVLLERNTNSLTKEIAALSKKEGEQIGREREKARNVQEAYTLEEGKRQGAETERASGAASGAQSAPPTSSDATLQAVTAAAAAAAAIAAPAAAALAAPPAAAIAAPPAADIAAPPVVHAVVPPAVEQAVKAAFAKQQLEEKK